MWLPLTHPLLGTWPATQAGALNGNRPFGSQADTQSTESHQPGQNLILFTGNLYIVSIAKFYLIIHYHEKPLIFLILSLLKNKLSPAVLLNTSLNKNCIEILLS